MYALVLNQPTDRPAQPLAFGLFACGGDMAWWGGPTGEPFAIVALRNGGAERDRLRPDGTPRVFLTAQTALYVPGRDHAPEASVESVRVFAGSIWLSPDQVELYRAEGAVLLATDDVLFDAEPNTLAERLRGRP